MDNAFSLIYKSPSTYLATINFADSTVSYKLAFPAIDNMQTAVFTSPTVYYAGSHDPNFNTGQSPTWYILNGGKS